MGDPGRIPQTKLLSPKPCRFLVENRHLPAWCEEASHAAAILFVAPAGFGKTTALLGLRDHFSNAGIRSVWIQLDAADNHPGPFRRLVLAALGDSGRDGTPAEQIAGLATPTALFLDDFESIGDPEVLAEVRSMIEALPDGCHLVIASRSVPELKLARLKAQGRLLSVGAEELAFDLDQAHSFFNQRYNFGLDEESIRRLVDTAEGWPAGLQLAALALSSRPDKRATIDRLGQQTDDIGDYLSEEVFSQQPPQIRSFLLDTSILVQLEGPLCDAVTGRADAASVLRRLEQDNLFISRIGEDIGHYRYHPLFAGFLARKLSEEDPARLAVLHGRAACWYRDHGEPDHAIDHALAAGDHELSCCILATRCWSAMAEGRIRMIYGWLTAIPSPVLVSQPSLMVALCWSCILHGHYAEATELAERMRCDPRTADLDEFRVIEPLALAMLGKIRACERLLAAHPITPAPGTTADGVLHNIRAYLDLCAGRFERCFAELAAAKLSFAGTGNLYGPVFTTTIETQALVARGHLQQAMDLARATYECATVEDGSGSLIRSQLGVYLAETLYEAGEYEQALKMSGDHAETMRNIGMIDGVVIAARVLARCRSRLGEFAAARRDIEITKEFGHRAGHRRIVAAMSIEEQLLEIRQFGTEAGTGLAAISIEDETWRQLEGWTIGSNNVETIDVARCRLWIHTGEAERALRALPPMIHQAQQCGRRRLALKFRVLLAEAYSVAGLEEKALRIARDAVEEGMPQGFVALFQEEGEPLTVLLRRVLCAGPPDHLARFLDILDAQPEARASSAVPAPTPLAPLSDRELQVLRCLAAGMSNRAIGEQLFISEPTVKFHLRNINSKLGASNRTHAVHLARANGLLRK